MNYRFEPAAQWELLEAANWYFDEGGELLAKDFEATALRAVRLVASMPLLGTRVYPGTRGWPLRRFPYTFAYRIEDGSICALAVALQSRELPYRNVRLELHS